MTNGSGFAGKSASRRYYAAADDGQEWPPELHDYNKRFAKVLEGIKRRHDSVVTTVGESSLSWAFWTPLSLSLSSGNSRVQAQATTHAN